MLAMSAESGPTVRRRIRHSTGSRKLNLRTGVGIDISSWISQGTSNSAVRIIMGVNMDAWVYSDVNVCVKVWFNVCVNVCVNVCGLMCGVMCGLMCVLFVCVNVCVNVWFNVCINV